MIARTVINCLQKGDFCYAGFRTYSHRHIANQLQSELNEHCLALEYTITFLSLPSNSPHIANAPTLYATFMKTLLLPPTIRTARPDEVPKQSDILNRIAESHTANIVEGYIFQYNETHELPFAFFAEINVDNDRLWTLFKSLLLQLPDEICLVCNFKDGEPSYSGYADKFEVLNKLEMFQLEITQDGFLEVGVLYNDETFMEEVFIRSAKYLQYWGADEKRFRQTMAEFELNQVNTLNFIDQYPLVTEALRVYHSDATETGEVLVQLGAIVPTEE